MNILFIGDVFATIGRRVLSARLKPLLEERNIDCCIANCENAAGGHGLTANLTKKIRKYGVDILTGGNHSFSIPDQDRSFMDLPYVLRPFNYPPGNFGHGSTLYVLADGRSLGVVNLQGRTFHHEALDCPFRTGKEAVEELASRTTTIIVDFHAEATSEKMAFATWMNGAVSAVVGTHTHVQTADDRILPCGTAFISDAGMTGPEDSIIGMKADEVIHRFLYQTHIRFEPSTKGAMFNGVIIDIDDRTGKARTIERVYERIELS
ncbi:MAG: TIGR00282 family metallophosphoesterase [Chitinispirillaceae bacterium]|nr:TIGR00282 family metallophosphoesterase [Chitinispirillaceae bacterium]